MTLNLSNLKPRIDKRARKRVGRGLGSGHGAYSGRGIKGQKARSGGSIPPGFEGGRMPFIRQVPKLKGFKSPRPKSQALTLEAIAKAFPSGGIVSPSALQKRGLIRDENRSVKVVGKASLSVKIEFQNIKLSAAAREAVAKAGGSTKDVE